MRAGPGVRELLLHPCTSILAVCVTNLKVTIVQRNRAMNRGAAVAKMIPKVTRGRDQRPGSRVGLRGQGLANCERNLSRCDTDLRPLTPDLCLRHSADVPPAQVASRRRHDSRRDGGATPLGQSADVGLSGGCFGKHGNHFAIERGKVIRFAAGDQLAIANDFLVFPVRSGVLQVGLERRP